MSSQRFTPEFKEEAVRQVLDRGYSVAEISARLGVQTCAKSAKPVASIGLPRLCVSTRSAPCGGTSPPSDCRLSLDHCPTGLNRQFTVDAPDRVWVTDFTYLRTWQGWLYLAVVIDLHSCKEVGWSMKSSLDRALILDALLMALWGRKPSQSVIVHSDQGSQYGSDDWQRFCRSYQLQPSMSRRGNCWDNAVAVAFFSRR